MMKYMLLLLLVIIISCKPANVDKATEEVSEPKWESIFDGETLEGWTPKIVGFPLGENHNNTFRVEDGAITVSYEEYDQFDNKFGHLFYKEEFSNYKLRLDYRFIGDQVPGGEGWAYKNSGVMYHGQSAESMEIDQDFPVCMEGQFLGGNGKDERPTGNLCTPGTHVNMGDTLTTTHCINSSSPTFHGEEWVKYEMIVHGGDDVYQLINGDTVLIFTKPVIGGNFLPEGLGLEEGTLLTGGTISLQSESHPIQFRNIEVMRLDEE